MQSNERRILVFIRAKISNATMQRRSESNEITEKRRYTAHHDENPNGTRRLVYTDEYERPFVSNDCVSSGSKVFVGRCKVVGRSLPPRNRRGVESFRKQRYEARVKKPSCPPNIGFGEENKTERTGMSFIDGLGSE